MNPLEQFYAALGTQQQRAPPQTDLVTFGTMSFERTALRTPGNSDKTLLYQDDATAQVAAKGLRLPRLHEVMQHVIIPGIEGKLTPVQQPVFDDMFRSYGEWTSDLVLPHGDHLYIAEGTIVWNQNQYDQHQVTATTATRHKSKGLPRETWLSLKDVDRVDPSIITTLYSKPLKQLPSDFRNAYLWLPPEGVVRPVGRGSFNSNLYAGTCYVSRAARGVKFSVPSETGVSSSSSSRIAQ